MVKFDTYVDPHVIFHNMSNNKNSQITDYKTDSITKNVIILIANSKS